MSTRVKIIAAIMMIMSLGAGAIYSLPYLTIYGILDAVVRQDQQQLAELIDFSQIRGNLKSFIGAKLQSVDKPPQADAWGKIKDSLVNRIISQAVEDLVTPEGLASFMKRRLEALATEDIGRKDSPPSAGSLFMAFLRHADLAYTSPAEFLITYKEGESGAMRFVLRRNGLTWRLTNIEF